VLMNLRKKLVFLDAMLCAHDFALRQRSDHCNGASACHLHQGR
jgi:predicted transposase YbfD/YdcC